MVLTPYLLSMSNDGSSASIWVPYPRNSVAGENALAGLLTLLEGFSSNDGDN